MSPEELQAKQQAEQQRFQRLRESALMLADDDHGNDENIMELKHAKDDAELAEKKFQDELQALRMDSQMARAKYEQALDEFINPKYRLSEKDWESVFARFARG
jgi:hypothetical protein